MRYKAVCGAIRRFKTLMQTNPTVTAFADCASRLLKMQTKN
jgi:predicted ATPase